MREKSTVYVVWKWENWHEYVKSSVFGWNENYRNPSLPGSHLFNFHCFLLKEKYFAHAQAACSITPSLNTGNKNKFKNHTMAQRIKCAKNKFGLWGIGLPLWPFFGVDIFFLTFAWQSESFPLLHLHIAVGRNYWCIISAVMLKEQDHHWRKR